MKDDVLRYLGYQGVVDPETDELIDRYMEELKHHGKYVYQVFDYDQGQVLATSLKFKGRSIENILKGINKLVLFAATMGHDVDQKIRKLSYQSSSEMMIYDACASGGVEDLIDKMVEEIEGYKTPRFSPGYGDLSLEYQGDIIRVLNGEKKLGITVSTSHLMTPKKSVTGIIGLSNSPVNNNYKSCDDCLLRTSCDQKICKRSK